MVAASPIFQLGVDAITGRTHSATCHLARLLITTACDEELQGGQNAVSSDCRVAKLNSRAGGNPIIFVRRLVAKFQRYASVIATEAKRHGWKRTTN